MKYLIISDYPYHTVKTFFEELDEALKFVPEDNSYSHHKRLLYSRIYELDAYKETEHGISYTLHNPSFRINLNINETI